ncbi:hypothetical protein HJG60_011355 [Phyllostomus discolor]|uniref:Uncharacterized protein n=1 Tax=Phyllostomus discolor TaxID=89673 RepID=A0A834A2Q5_9CHIR|nr:hypothetical protein HJG60_011355 [Phyllostomus discolor]
MGCDRMRCDGMVCSVPTLLHTWNQDLSLPSFVCLSISLSLPLSPSHSYTHVHMCLHYINTLHSYPTCCIKVCSASDFTEGTLSQDWLWIVWWGNQEKVLTWGRTDLALKVHLANPAPPGYLLILIQIVKFYKTRTVLFANVGFLFSKAIIRVLMIKQGTLGHRGHWF